MSTKLQLLLEKIDYKNLFEADVRRVDVMLAHYRSEKNKLHKIEFAKSNFKCCGNRRPEKNGQAGKQICLFS